MADINGKAHEYKAACADLQALDVAMGEARAKLTELEEKHRKASMRRTEAQRQLLEAAKA